MRHGLLTCSPRQSTRRSTRKPNSTDHIHGFRGDAIKCPDLTGHTQLWSCMASRGPRSVVSGQDHHFYAQLLMSLPISTRTTESTLAACPSHMSSLGDAGASGAALLGSVDIVLCAPYGDAICRDTRSGRKTCLLWTERAAHGAKAHDGGNDGPCLLGCWFKEQHKGWVGTPDCRIFTRDMLKNAAWFRHHH